MHSCPSDESGSYHGLTYRYKNTPRGSWITLDAQRCSAVDTSPSSQNVRFEEACISNVAMQLALASLVQLSSGDFKMIDIGQLYEQEAILARALPKSEQVRQGGASTPIPSTQTLSLKN
ncbi:hypothetical protein BC938DRAFT_481181 [Jimgerdemannia flammicorona]|uniref:Uncharacterized protein n=1 Tax=Jimgerdemannia flammicorona TaxID=994334 RepID=A0A433QGR9_9FUNG|nr:hypothetical protein BC938DRAFT_481181 [Jimgerdemannia flammicorona]